MSESFTTAMTYDSLDSTGMRWVARATTLGAAICVGLAFAPDTNALTCLAFASMQAGTGWLCWHYYRLARSRAAMMAFLTMELDLVEQGIPRPRFPHSPPHVVNAARKLLWDSFGCAIKGDPKSPSKHAVDVGLEA